MSHQGEGTAQSPFLLPISIRAYAEAIDDQNYGDGNKGAPGADRRKKKPRAKRVGPSIWTLVWDCETTTDPTQRLRLAFYRLFRGNKLDEERLVIDRDALAPAEIACAERYCATRGLLPPMDLADFQIEVMLKRAYELGATIVTFNGAFDFARAALAGSNARATTWRPKMQDGFSLAFSPSTRMPRLQIKSLNPRAYLCEWSAPGGKSTSRSHRRRGENTPVHRGHFCDVKTIAAALLSRSHSLESLTRALGTATQKRQSDSHGYELDDAYIDYARDDVKATWECYRILCDRYAVYQLDMPIYDLISEASIGKSALSTMNIRPWREVQPGGPDGGMTSRVISSYYGGRTEVHRRREVVRVIQTDFTSMYPTVCVLQNLWKFIIGEGFTAVVATDEIRAFLEAATPETFRDRDIWRHLTALVRLTPGGELVPIRGEYPGQVHATIGLNFLHGNASQWFTLADCLVAKFLTGKTPPVEEAILFSPGPPQAGLKPIRLVGRHTIDPYNQDFFRELIRTRQLEDASKAGKSPEEQAVIEELRNALKILANATSYGIFVQMNVNAARRGQRVRVWCADGRSFERTTKKVETPGPWFNPLIATLITGAARLMLALAERKALDAGLDWAFCDTDSLALAKPSDMDDATFEARALSVVEWFKPLNPYGFEDSILKIEKINYAPGAPTRLVPLYCYAISSKRYALFNIDEAGVPVIRKASAHGLGHLLSPYPDEDAPPHFPAPLTGVIGGREKLLRWHYDVWFAILSAVLAGHPNQVRFDYHPAMKAPTVSRYTASSPELLGWFAKWNMGKPYAEQLKPFGFLYILHASRRVQHPDDGPDTLARGPGRPGKIYPVAPFEKDLSTAIAKAFDRVTGLPIDLDSLETYEEALKAYPFRPEAKFLNGRAYDTGPTERCHVRAQGAVLIGKEADRWEEEYVLGLGATELQVTYGPDAEEYSAVYGSLRRAIRTHGKSAVFRETGISRATLANIERGWVGRVTKRPSEIRRSLVALDDRSRSQTYLKSQQRLALEDAIRCAGGLRPAAKVLNCDPSNLSKRLTRLRLKGRGSEP